MDCTKIALCGGENIFNLIFNNRHRLANSSFWSQKRRGNERGDGNKLVPFRKTAIISDHRHPHQHQICVGVLTIIINYTDNIRFKRAMSISKHSTDSTMSLDATGLQDYFAFIFYW